MVELKQSEKEFIARGLVLEVMWAPPEFAIAHHAAACEIAEKLGCHAELVAAAKTYSTLGRITGEWR